jgi:nucleotide-binding universal stress UspA family protein
MESQVIVPLDGSTNAEAILPHALFFALQTESALTLLRVIMPPEEPGYAFQYIPDDWYAGEVGWTKNYLACLATRIQPQGARVHIQHVEGTSAGAAINSYAEQHAGMQLIALAHELRNEV